MTASVKAIVHVSTENVTFSIIQSLLDFGLDPIYEITGNYDIMFIIAASNIEVLNEIIDKIKNINGVISTSTEIVLKEINND